MFNLIMYDKCYAEDRFNDYAGIYQTESECYTAIREACKNDYPPDNYQIVSGTEIIMWGQCAEV